MFAGTAPATALFWDPGSADANTRMADQMLQKSSTVAGSPVMRDHALRALRRQPVDAEAARQLGISAAAAGQGERAARLLAFAEMMSQRDLATQLVLIEDSVGHGDVAGALLHYDRAMRTNPSSWPLLFPVLSRAADAPAVGMPLTGYLMRRPPWWRPFLEQYVPQSGSAAMLYAVARRMGLDRSPTPDAGMLQAIEKRLVDLGGYRPAAALYHGAHGQSLAGGALLQNGDFEQPGGWDPFDWSLVDEPDLSAQRQPSPAGRGTALFLSAANGRGGTVAEQLLILPIGRYRIGAQVGAVGGDKLAYPQLIVVCAASGHELIHQSFPPASVTGKTWAIDLAVPADCPAQRLVIQARSPLDRQDAVPWIDRVTVHPATPESQR